MVAIIVNVLLSNLKIKILLKVGKLDFKYAGIFLIRFVYWIKLIAMTENTATIIPNGIYFSES